MDFIALPLELLQKILSYLSFVDLKSSSLVCHRWNQASGVLIGRKAKFRISQKAYDQAKVDNSGSRFLSWFKPKLTAHNNNSHLEIILNSTRSYQTILIPCIEDWQLQQTAISAIVRKFPKIRALILEDVHLQCLIWLSKTYQEWIEQCDFLHVWLKDRFYEHYLSDPSPHVLILPNLRHLIWWESSIIQKRITIEAPKLDTARFDASHASSALLVIQHYDRIKHVTCKLRANTFTKTFAGCIENIETLQLDLLYANSDISFLQRLHRLRSLSIRYHYEKRALIEVEEMKNCVTLRSLKITLDKFTTNGTLNILTMFKNFPALKTLQLFHINLQAESTVKAKELADLTLQNATFHGDALIIDAPNLRKLSLSVNVLSKLSLIDANRLTQLVIFQHDTTSLIDLLQQTVFPFLERHDSVTSLVLSKSILDQSESNNRLNPVRLKVEHLELQWIHLGVDFLRMISKWQSLRSLTLLWCTINCDGLADSDLIRFPTVQRMVLRGVELRNTMRTDIPLVAGR